MKAIVTEASQGTGEVLVAREAVVAPELSEGVRSPWDYSLAMCAKMEASECRLYDERMKWGASGFVETFGGG